MLLRNAKLYGQENRWDIEFRKDKIHSITPVKINNESNDNNVIDLNGKIVHKNAPALSSL